MLHAAQHKDCATMNAWLLLQFLLMQRKDGEEANAGGQDRISFPRRERKIQLAAFQPVRVNEQQSIQQRSRHMESRREMEDKT